MRLINFPAYTHEYNERLYYDIIIPNLTLFCLQKRCILLFIVAVRWVTQIIILCADNINIIWKLTMTIRFTRSLALYLNDLRHAPPPMKKLDENVNGGAPYIAIADTPNNNKLSLTLKLLRMIIDTIKVKMLN